MEGMSGGPHHAPDDWYEAAAEAASGGITVGGRGLGDLVDKVVEACWSRAASPPEISQNLERESFMEIYEQNQRQFGLPIERADGAEADSFDAFYKALTAEAQIFGVAPTVAQALCASLTEPHRWLWSRLEAANRQADAEQARALRGASQPGEPNQAPADGAERSHLGVGTNDGASDEGATPDPALRVRPEPEGERLTEQSMEPPEFIYLRFDANEATWGYERTSESDVVYVRAALRDAPPQDGERLTKLVGRILKGYQRRVPCSCHDCRRDAGATDGVGTNGGCHHANLRQLQTVLRGPAGDQP